MVAIDQLGVRAELHDEHVAVERRQIERRAVQGVALDPGGRDLCLSSRFFIAPATARIALATLLPVAPSPNARRSASRSGASSCPVIVLASSSAVLTSAAAQTLRSAEWAEYGYRASHSRYFRGVRPQGAVFIPI
jgi:hypothetical protein